MIQDLTELLQSSAATHSHLCPRQVLGVRMGILAGQILRVNLPRTDKRLLVIAETDGCMIDGISAATGCWAGRRTLRVEDIGKIAAIFIDTATECCFRIVPHPEARLRAAEYAPEATDRWMAQLLGYQRMPNDALLIPEAVTLSTPIAVIIGEAGRRVICQGCREEIINQREIIRGGTILCRTCAGQAHYRPLFSGNGQSKTSPLTAGFVRLA